MLDKDENDKNKKTLLKGDLKGMKQIEAISKYRQSIVRKKKKIQQLYHQSISNQIYIFPRAKRTSTGSSETQQESLDRAKEEIFNLQYDLKSQNKRNQNYQISSNLMIRCSSITSSQAEMIDSKRKDRLDSQRLKKQQNELKSEVNLSNYQSKSRKEKNEEKTASNSNKKIFFLPPNRTHKNHVCKPSETIIVSFRGKHAEKGRNQKSEIY